MKYPVVCVIGHEGSGTQWLTYSLPLHPDVGRTLHQSYPVRWNGSPYKPLGEYQDVPLDAPVLVMMRDATCSAQSNENRRFFAVDPSRRNRRSASDEMWRDIYERTGPVVECSYEGLVEEGNRYMAFILQRLGLDPQAFDWGTWLTKYKPSDGNLKYFK